MFACSYQGRVDIVISGSIVPEQNILIGFYLM